MFGKYRKLESKLSNIEELVEILVSYQATQGLEVRQNPNLLRKYLNECEYSQNCIEYIKELKNEIEMLEEMLTVKNDEEAHAKSGKGTSVRCDFCIIKTAFFKGRA